MMRAREARRFSEARNHTTARRGGQKGYVWWRRGGRPPGLLLVFVVRAGALVLLGLVVERLVRDAEDLRGLAAVAVGHVERLFDDDALDLFHRLAVGDVDRVAIAAAA